MIRSRYHMPFLERNTFYNCERLDAGDEDGFVSYP